MESRSNFKQVSKFENLSYGQSKAPRFDNSGIFIVIKETIAPGPGKYREINSLQKTGHYVLSQNKGGTKAKFDKDRR